MSRGGKINGAFVQAMPPQRQWKRIKPKQREPLRHKVGEDAVLEAQRVAVSATEEANKAARWALEYHSRGREARKSGRVVEAAAFEKLARENEEVAKRAHRRKRDAESVLSKALGARVEVKRVPGGDFVYRRDGDFEVEIGRGTDDGREVVFTTPLEPSR